ncbi:MAG: hypothetical protein JW860_05415 [Sedimentisphaerales bacterium]|nr:hypothetical protein [Sedimentisphaerales bacterium]
MGRITSIRPYFQHAACFASIDCAGIIICYLFVSPSVKPVGKFIEHFQCLFRAGHDVHIV